MGQLFNELKRRNVFRVGIAYVVVGWLLVQVTAYAVPAFSMPPWVNTVVFYFILIGFPLALLFAWAYELTPEGLKRSHQIDPDKSITHVTGQRINKLIVGALVLALGFIAYDKMVVEETTVVEEAQAAVTSIAVLPFVNMSNDPDQEYFSDGISEEILNVLVRVDGLSVASRTSSFAFKGRNPNIPEIAATLNVDHILEGSVKKQGKRVRITAQLIDVKTDRHLWSESYNRELTDIFKIQDEISNAIVIALKDTLGIETLEAVSVQPMTENMSAYDSYLKGRGLFLSRADLPGSAAYLEQAVALDDSFAGAWETLAATYSAMPSWGFLDRPYYELSTQAADKAIALDSNLSLAYAVKGSNLSLGAMKQGHLPDWKATFEYLDQAIENNPKNATAHFWRAINFLFLGFFEKALGDFDICLRIDPTYGSCKRHKANALIVNGQGAAGIELYKQRIGEDLPFYGAILGILSALVRKGMNRPFLSFCENFPGLIIFLPVNGSRPSRTRTQITAKAGPS